MVKNKYPIIGVGRATCTWRYEHECDLCEFVWESNEVDAPCPVCGGHYGKRSNLADWLIVILGIVVFLAIVVQIIIT